MTLAAARALAGGADELERLMAVGLARPAGDRVQVLRPKLVRTIAEMSASGVPLDSLIRAYSTITPSTEHIAQVLVAAGADYFTPQLSMEQQPTSQDVEELVTKLTRFRELALASVNAALATSIEQLIERTLSDFLAAYVERTDADTG